MRLWIVLFLLTVCGSARAQDKTLSSEAAPVTVPATLNHNRVVIAAELPLPNGSTQKVRVWVDNGNADLCLSRRLATLLALPVTCTDQECASPPPPEMMVGGMKIPLAEIKVAKIPLKPVAAAAVMAAGMNAEINLPASILRHYDVLIDFPGHKFSIGPPGSLHFLGPSTKVLVNPENGLIQVPSQIDNKKYNLALDVGASMSFLAEDMFDKIAAANPDWPHMTGAVGAANMWGLGDESNWKLMRLDRVQFGPLFLANVAVVAFPKTRMEFFEKRAGVPTVGLIGADVFLNYRVGLDYAHATIYFDIGRLYNFPEFDVVGLTLKPEDDGNFTVLGIADYEGKPAVPAGPDGVHPGDHLVAVDGIGVSGATMGQVWSMLGGTPGQERKLTIERAGKEFVVAATVEHFLAELPDEKDRKKKKK